MLWGVGLLWFLCIAGLWMRGGWLTLRTAMQNESGTRYVVQVVSDARNDVHLLSFKGFLCVPYILFRGI